MSTARRPGRPGTPTLAARGVTKRYGTLTANDAVTVEFNAGQVHAILGENGDRKSVV